METNKTNKIIYTAVVYYHFLVLGLRFGIVGPSLLDLKDNLQVSYNEISGSVSWMSIGICIGSILSGFCIRFMSFQVTSVLLMSLSTILVGVVTYVTEYKWFLAVNLFLGASTGAAISICEAWVMDIWGKDCGPWMQALQFFRVMGYILAPIMMQPFVKEFAEEEVNVTVSVLSTTTVMTPGEANPLIHIPFLISGGTLLFGALLSLGLCLLGVVWRTTSTESQTSIVTMETCTKENVVIQMKNSDEKRVISTKRVKWFGYIFIGLSSLLYFFIYEDALVTYLPSFGTKITLQLCKSQANWLATSYNVANIVGKAISVGLSTKLHHVTMIYLNLFIMLGSLILLIIFAEVNVYYLWTGIVLHGLGMSSIIATMYTMLESAVNVNALICGILNMFGNAGIIVWPYIMGPLMDTMPKILLYSALACTISCIVIAFVQTMLLRYKLSLIAVRIKHKAETVSKRELY